MWVRGIVKDEDEVRKHAATEWSKVDFNNVNA